MPHIACPAFQNPCRGTPRPLSPSSFKAEAANGNGFVNLSLDAAALGTEVHEVLAQIEWFDDAQGLQLDDLSKDAAELLRGFLKNPVAQEVFTKPGEHSEVWCETAFDVMLDGQWISGVFDRVVIRRSQDGSPVSAIIYDFKTDHGSPAEIEERYAGQMLLYRQAVCRLLRLAPDCVKFKTLCLR